MKVAERYLGREYFASEHRKIRIRVQCVQGWPRVGGFAGPGCAVPVPVCAASLSVTDHGAPSTRPRSRWAVPGGQFPVDCWCHTRSLGGGPLPES